MVYPTSGFWLFILMISQNEFYVSYTSTIGIHNLVSVRFWLSKHPVF